MEAQAATSAPSLRARFQGVRRSDTAQAAGLAVATMLQQLTAVVFTVVFTRILGTDGYGSLAALINFSVILIVPGSALQVAAARQGTLGRLGSGAELAATLDRWTRHVLVGIGVVAIVSVLARAPLADLVNVDEEWAAAAVPVSAAVWLLVCLQRGLLQAARAYRPVAISIVAEGVIRILGSLVLVAAALEVTGAYLGLLVAWTALAIVLGRLLRERLGAPARDAERHPLSALARNAAIPTAGLIFVAALQNVDVIMARHALDDDTAGVYAAATVAAKFVVWVAVGIGLWTLPEATRRAAAGLDPRPVLARALGVVAVIALPALALFAIVPGLLLRVAFGADYESGADVLLLLGTASALLAVTFVTVQFLLGLHRRAFVIGLLVAAAVEPLVLWDADTLHTFAVRVLALQAVTAAAIVLVGALTRRDDHAGAEPLL
jgi:O-antigen/teichoic acid export membrane protein